MMNVLNNLMTLAHGRSRAITAENPTGAKGAGGKAEGPLGKGRKGRAFLSLNTDETVTLADIGTGGVIQHIWITVAEQTPTAASVLRDLVLRIYWDDEEEPSVETPLGDFFCNGFGIRTVVNSLPIVVAPTGGMNCFFPMPFKRSARVTITNEHPAPIQAFFYQIDYMEVDNFPDEVAYFHAQWRREPLTRLKEDYVLVDSIQGKGQYVGTYLAVAQLQRYWWGEGEVKFYIDGDDEYPTICGTGIEDYVGGAWAFQTYNQDKSVNVQTYSSPFMGYPLYLREHKTETNPYTHDTVPMHGMYRWHLTDPVRFDRDLKVTVQQIGHDGQRLFERADDYSSVAYWYQLEPHARFPDFPERLERSPR